VIISDDFRIITEFGRIAYLDLLSLYNSRKKGNDTDISSIV
jgi:hypothetical protein